MMPYSIIKEVNPHHAKGSATGAMNFLVFVITALTASAIDWWMQRLAGGAPLTLRVFDTAGNALVSAILVAAILTLLLKETGAAVRGTHNRFNAIPSLRHTCRQPSIFRANKQGESDDEIQRLHNELTMPVGEFGALAAAVLMVASLIFLTPPPSETKKAHKKFFWSRR